MQTAHVCWWLFDTCNLGRRDLYLSVCCSVVASLSMVSSFVSGGAFHEHDWNVNRSDTIDD